MSDLIGDEDLAEVMVGQAGPPFCDVLIGMMREDLAAYPTRHPWAIYLELRNGLTGDLHVMAYMAMRRAFSDTIKPPVARLIDSDLPEEIFRTLRKEILDIAEERRQNMADDGETMDPYDLTMLTMLDVLDVVRDRVERNIHTRLKADGIQYGATWFEPKTTEET